MPQMGPMQWEMLFLLTMIMVIMMASKLFFSSKNNGDILMGQDKVAYKTHKIQWSW